MVFVVEFLDFTNWTLVRLQQDIQLLSVMSLQVATQVIRSGKGLCAQHKLYAVLFSVRFFSQVTIERGWLDEGFANRADNPW